MAVKAVRVYVDDERCRHGPIKLGACGGIACDAVSRLCVTPSRAGDAADTVKVTGDTLLSTEDFTALVRRACSRLRLPL